MKRSTCAVLLAATLLAGAFIPAGQASILRGIDRAGIHRGSVAKHYVEVDRGTFVAVKGSRERRQVRYFRLRDGWSADQAATDAEYGFPVFRYRSLGAGVTTEVWSYPEKDVEVVFDASGRKIESRLR